jgi:hypothetical protein
MSRRPYATDLTTEGWQQMPLRWLDVRTLTFQRDVDLMRVIQVMQTKGVPGPVLVVCHEGIRYIEDGHHRVAAALMRDRPTILARLLDLDAGAAA